MPKLTYNAEKHWYYIDDIWVPSVTQVISPLNDFDRIPIPTLAAKCKWGSQIDIMCEYHLAGNLDENSLSDAQKRVLSQFIKFLDTEGRGFDFTACVTKHRGCNERLKFAGESDIIIPEQAVIDIKTRTVNKLTDPLQLIAYENIYTSENPTTATYENYILSLFENKYEFKQVNKSKTARRDSWSRFRYMLDKAWNEIEFKQKIKIWKGEK